MSRGQATIEMTVLITVLLTILVAMSTPFRRAIAGYWWNALHSGQSSSYLYGNPKDKDGNPTYGSTAGSGTLRVHENRRDVFMGVRLKGDNGRQAVVARINSTVDDRTNHLCSERISVRP